MKNKIIQITTYNMLFCSTIIAQKQKIYRNIYINKKKNNKKKGKNGNIRKGSNGNIKYLNLLKNISASQK